MIFAAVGTQKFPMDRLVTELDRIAGEGLVTEEIFIQSGTSTCEPRHIQHSPYLEKKDMDARVADCSILICHAGVGTILTGLKAGKKVIVVPRRAAFGEHVDDHQLEIAQSFARAGYVRAVEDVADLADALRDSAGWQPKPFESNKDKFSELILSLIADA